VSERRSGDEPLRGALELAFAVAVAGARMRPPLPSPPSLRPYLRFQKLPPAALGPVRRAVEGDDEFRQRVATVANEDLAGRAGWLWLVRPDGWEDELATLLDAGAQESSAAADARTERAAAKRADAAEVTARRATGELAAARTELAAAVERRRELEAAHSRLDRRVAQLEIELRGARRRVEQADLDAAAASERVGAADERTGDAEARLAMVEARLNEAEARAQVAEAALELARRGAEAPPAPPPPAEVTPPAERSDDRLTTALRDAAAATERLGEALAAAADAITPTAPRPESPAPSSQRPRRARRQPLALPGGVFADTVQAATHLVRQPGVTLVVDGYNAAKLGWPDETLPLQRERLLDLLEELVARHGTAVHVVFDGADVPVVPVRRRRRMHVEFSPPGIPADDVIVDLVSATPADRPVIVATNDNEVRTGARRGGANIISSQQLLTAARR
jgi:predicted RNA-binding protein with PIN domain